MKNREDNEYMGTREAAERWGVPQSTVRYWCYKRRIPDIEQDDSGTPYRIPKDAKPPIHKELKMDIHN